MALNTQMHTITEKHSIYILTSLREGLRQHKHSFSCEKVCGLKQRRTASQREVCEEYGSDNKVPDPSQTSYRLDVLKKFSLPTGEETHVM